MFCIYILQSLFILTDYTTYFSKCTIKKLLSLEQTTWGLVIHSGEGTTFSASYSLVSLRVYVKLACII